MKHLISVFLSLLIASTFSCKETQTSTSQNNNTTNAVHGCEMGQQVDFIARAADILYISCDSYICIRKTNNKNMLSAKNSDVQIQIVDKDGNVLSGENFSITYNTLKTWVIKGLVFLKTTKPNANGVGNYLVEMNKHPRASDDLSTLLGKSFSTGEWQVNENIITIYGTVINGANDGCN